MGNAKNVYFHVYIFCVAFGSTATSCQTYYQNKNTLYAVLGLRMTTYFGTFPSCFTDTDQQRQNNWSHFSSNAGTCYKGTVVKTVDY